MCARVRADVDMAVAMTSRLAKDGFVIVGAQDFAVLGRAAAPAAAGAVAAEIEQ